MLFSCYYHVVLMLFSCYSHVILMVFSCYSHVVLMLFWCYSHVVLMLFSCCSHVILMLFSCCSHVLLMLFSCCSHVILMFFHVILRVDVQHVSRNRSSHSATLPEWLEPPLLPERLSGWVAEWLSGCTKPIWQNVSVSQWSVSSITQT